MRLLPRLSAVTACVAAVALLVAFPAAAQPAMPDTSAFRLDDYQWENRLLLVFAASPKAPAYEQQKRLLQAEPADEVAARDLLVIKVLGEGQSRAGDRTIGEAAAQRLRQHFGVGPEAFAVVLVGKDGTEKRREDAPVKLASLFDTIDAMPMRQREMREQARDDTTGAGS